MVVPYGHKKTIIMLERDDTVYSEQVERGQLLVDHKDEESGLTLEELGFSMAFTIECSHPNCASNEGGYLNDEEEFKDFFDVHLTYMAWDINDPLFFTAYDQIPIRKCDTFEAEGIQPPNDIQNKVITRLEEKMYCIDDRSKYKIYGSEATDQTGFIMLDVEQCDPEKRPTCNTNQTDFNNYLEKLGWLTV